MRFACDAYYRELLHELTKCNAMLFKKKKRRSRKSFNGGARDTVFQPRIVLLSVDVDAIHIKVTTKSGSTYSGDIDVD